MQKNLQAKYSHPKQQIVNLHYHLFKLGNKRLNVYHDAITPSWPSRRGVSSNILHPMERCRYEVSDSPSLASTQGATWEWRTNSIFIHHLASKGPIWQTHIVLVLDIRVASIRPIRRREENARSGRRWGIQRRKKRLLTREMMLRGRNPIILVGSLGIYVELRNNLW